jgi:hypothetical protein
LAATVLYVYWNALKLASIFRLMSWMQSIWNSLHLLHPVPLRPCRKWFQHT